MMSRPLRKVSSAGMAAALSCALAAACESDLPAGGYPVYKLPDTAGACDYLTEADASMPSGSTPSGNELDAGVMGADGGVDEEYRTFETAFIYIDLICRRSADCGIDDFQECVERVPTLDQVCWTTAELTEEPEGDAEPVWTDADKEACRLALIDMDQCSLELACPEYEFFLVNTVGSFDVDRCINADGNAIPCPDEYPCRSEKLGYFASCLDFIDLLNEAF